MRSSTILAAVAVNVSSVLAADGCMTNEQCPEIAALEHEECEDYHMFQARGSTAPYPGHLSDLMKLVCDGIDGSCGFENIVYPASNGNAWCSSANQGATGGQKQMQEYAKRCPNSKLIVLGFSQGGSVALDLLGGGGGNKVFGCDQPVNDALDRTKAPGSKKQVVAAASFGPTVRNADQTYTVGGGRDFNGTAVRSERALDGLDQYSDILRTWCNEGDPICAVGSEPMDVANHLNYFERYNDEASQWIIETAEKTAQSMKQGDGNGQNTTEESNGNGKGIIDQSKESIASREALAKILFFFLVAGSIMFCMLR
ncbi:alpha/beta-hydrolase [Polyplosphaeria fusca]|uniref:Alpha/beta-hydrolase n=1 Tax=Polyplosphaeria fusca TaxID=682080 RepID=A0A9P4QRU3_9PLEO|nr:alpha/beta-hydrolase [Polyplosphaeria fusca]